MIAVAGALVIAETHRQWVAALSSRPQECWRGHDRICSRVDEPRLQLQSPRFVAAPDGSAEQPGLRYFGPLMLIPECNVILFDYPAMPPSRQLIGVLEVAGRAPAERPNVPCSVKHDR